MRGLNAPRAVKGAKVKSKRWRTSSVDGAFLRGIRFLWRGELIRFCGRGRFLEKYKRGLRRGGASSELRRRSLWRDLKIRRNRAYSVSRSLRQYCSLQKHPLSEFDHETQSRAQKHSRHQRADKAQLPGVSPAARSADLQNVPPVPPSLDPNHLLLFTFPPFTF